MGYTIGGAGLNAGEPGGGGYAGTQCNNPGGAGGQNTGGGGGGGAHYDYHNPGGNGGSGIVIIRYLKSLGTSTFSSGSPEQKSSSIFSFDAANLGKSSSVEVLVVAGGAGGGNDMGGGGGAGGVVYNNAYSVSINTPISVTIGAGGAGATGYANNPLAGSAGGNTIFGGILTYGGGGGGSGHYFPAPYAGIQGQRGGSGGGLSPLWGRNTFNFGGAGFVGQGNAGGAAQRGDGQYKAGGGGGANQRGGSGGNTYSGNGGQGFLSAINGTSYYWGGGGGGAHHENVGGNGGTGGGGGGSGWSGGTAGTGGAGLNAGGNGVNATTSSVGGAGGANTGGGGGGGGHQSVGGAGGSGIVIVRYYGSQKATGGTITTSGGYTVHTFTSSGTFTPTDFLSLKDLGESSNKLLLSGGAARVGYDPNSYVEFSNDYDANLEITNNNFTGLTDFTMVSVFQVSGTHTNYHGTLISSGDWNVNHWAFAVNQDNASIQLRRPFLTYSYSFTLNTWYHVAWTRSGTNNTVYVNGNSIGSQTSPDGIPLVSNAGNAMIGRETYAGGYFNLNGRIAISTIYNRALSADEVSQNFNAQRSRFGI